MGICLVPSNLLEELYSFTNSASLGMSFVMQYLHYGEGEIVVFDNVNQFFSVEKIVSRIKVRTNALILAWRMCKMIAIRSGKNNHNRWVDIIKF